MDLTLDEVWEEARIALENKVMDKNWRSRFLDQWLSVEYELQRHGPMDIEGFEDEDQVNASKLTEDPFVKGV